MNNSSPNFATIGQAIFDMPKIGLVFSRPDTTIFLVNDALCNFVGYSKEELYNIKWPDITHPDDVNKDIREYTRIRNREIDSYTIEKRYLRKLGGIFWAEIDVKCVWKNEEEIDFFAAVIRDISERKVIEHRLEGQLELASNLNEQLKAQRDRMEEYTHVLSHDLRSPVSTLQSLVDLHDEVEEDEREQVRENLKRVSQNVLETINSVSQSMHEESTEKARVTGTSDPKEVFNWVKANLSHQIETSNTTIEFTGDPSITLPGKRNLYNSILQNLVTNAIKYSRPGVDPVITISLRKYEGHVILEVKDNGQGIDLDRYGNNLFKMYQTFHGGEEAHGIGLYLVKTQVESLNGSISVKSNVGEGTTFTITLPEPG